MLSNLKKQTAVRYMHVAVSRYENISYNDILKTIFYKPAAFFYDYGNWFFSTSRGSYTIMDKFRYD